MDDVIAEVYAIALERVGIVIERHMGIGSQQAALEALIKGDIDLYPARIRTAPGKFDDESTDSAGVVLDDSIKPFFGREHGITWLDVSPANVGPCLVASQYSSEEYWMITMEKCAEIALNLRIAVTKDFTAPNGALSKLQRYYGGFRFREVIVCEPGNQYNVLNRGDAEVASGSTADASIVEEQLGILGDDKGFWPKYGLAPMIRQAAFLKHPQVNTVLNRISNKLNQYSVQDMAMRSSIHAVGPREVAEEFLWRVGWNKRLPLR